MARTPQEIGDSIAFPWDAACEPGMSYRMWLIAQIMPGLVNTYAQTGAYDPVWAVRAADLAAQAVDAVLAQLAYDARQPESNPAAPA